MRSRFNLSHRGTQRPNALFDLIGFQPGSEQLPARAVYETDGPSRTVKVGSLTIQLKTIDRAIG